MMYFQKLAPKKPSYNKFIKEEETAFLRTLAKGIGILKDLLHRRQGIKTISGKLAFELYDTYGFPFDLTALIAREQQLTVDEKGFLDALAQQKNRSRNAAISQNTDWTIIDSTKSSSLSAMIA